MTGIPWSEGKWLLWDVTVVDTFASSYIANTSVEPAAAATKAEIAKVEKYMSFVPRYKFVPAGFETSGS